MSEKPRFQPAPLVVLRTPLLPFDEYREWAEGIELASAGGGEAVEKALRADRERLRRGLQVWLERPEIREALFLASPDLEQGLQLWQKDPDSKKGQRAERALVRYMVRMLARATPFGLFSGCSTGSLGEKTRLRLAPRESYRRHSRLDMDYLSNLTDSVVRDPSIRRELSFFPNTSLYRAGGRLRYAESRLEGRRRTYHLVAVESNEYVEVTLERARSGARIEKLAAALVDDDPEIELEEAVAFVNELVDTQILITDLSPLVTGEDSLAELVRRFQALAPAARLAERLEDVHGRLQGLDRAAFGAWSPEDYTRLAGDLEELGTPVELRRLLQVDMSKPAVELTLGPEVIEELQRGLRILRRLSGATSQASLDEFRRAFVERYEDGTELPLEEVLDEELGIGFQRSGSAAAEASPLLQGLSLGRPAESRVAWSEREYFLFRKLEEALTGGLTEVSVDEEEIADRVPERSVEMPDAFHVMGELLADSPEALAADDFEILLQGTAGPSGARLLGRFCHTDPELSAGTEAHLRAEEACEADAVFAEIVHLPEGRVGNVLRRPVLRGYEIPFLGRSGAPPERQIPLDDLRVSVRGPHILLRSERLDKRVIPRLTTAHNFSQGDLGIYRFLASLQSQRGVPGLSWSWGVFDNAPFVPRVRSGRLILQRARWWIEAREIEPLVKARGAERVEKLREWREKRRVPRLVVLVDFDNELLIDFENALLADTFFDLVKQRPYFMLAEFYPPPEKLCAEGPEGRYVHEFLVPFTVDRPATDLSPLLARGTGEASRNFPPGSRWLYAKLFTGTSTADHVLREVVAPLVRRLREEGIVKRWFFIRYGDPEWHLRLRFEGDPERLWSDGRRLLDEALEPLTAAGHVWRYEFSSYKREIARYGGPEAVELAERLFEIDSDAVVRIVELLEGDAGADARWRLAFWGMDALLNDFGFDLEGKLRLCETHAKGFLDRLAPPGQSGFHRQLAEKLRGERRSLFQWLERPGDLPDFEPGFAALRWRSETSAPIVAEILRLAEAGRLSLKIEELVPSFVHMFVNRLTRSAGPEHELVLYDFLVRTYQSQLARARKKPRRKKKQEPETGNAKRTG